MVRDRASDGEGDHAEHVKTLWTLGLGGLIPFLALTALLVYAGNDLIVLPMVVLALSAYSAVILSFLGGIRWGASLMTGTRGKRTLVLSVVPSIFAFVLILVPAPWCFAGFAVGFLAQGAWDIAAIRRGLLPHAFGKLRMVLTAVVVLCQIAALVSTY